MTQKTTNHDTDADRKNQSQSQDNIAQSPDDLVDPASSQEADTPADAQKPQTGQRNG